jgi:hypothetical protein
MSGATITELVKDKVYCLHNPFPLDGRLSAFPKRVRGWSSANCYVLKEPEGAYMLDTGYSAHRQSVIAQLDQVLDRTTPLTLFPLRITEYMSVGNGLAISRAFNVRECYATLPDSLLWLDLEGTLPDRKQPDIANKVLRGEMRLDPSGVGRRPMVGFTAPLRLLNTAWIYDEVNKILFSSDMFTHVWSDKIKGPWLMEDDDGVTSNAFVRSFLLGTGFWWLEGARSDPLRKGVRRVFETYDIEMICPGYGAMLKGRELVRKQFDVLDAVLADLDRSKVRGRYIAREPARRISEGAL